MLKSSSFEKKKIGKTSKNCFFWAQFELQKGQHGPCPKWKTMFFGRNNKSTDYQQLLETFYLIKISCLGWVMNLFLFCVMFFIKKGSFPAKTAVNTFNAVSTRTESVHIFQILYTRQFFCRFLSHAFTLCVHGRDNIEGNN